MCLRSHLLVHTVSKFRTKEKPQKRFFLPVPFPVVIANRPVRRESCLCHSESKINKQKYFLIKRLIFLFGFFASLRRHWEWKSVFSFMNKSEWMKKKVWKKLFLSLLKVNQSWRKEKQFENHEKQTNGNFVENFFFLGNSHISKCQNF